MRLTHWQGGGLGGRSFSVRTGPLEADDLARRAAGTVRESIDACRFFDLPARLPSPEPSPIDVDRLEHRLLVSDDARQHEVRWDDLSDAPRPLLRLAELLTSLDQWERVPWESWHQEDDDA